LIVSVVVYEAIPNDHYFTQNSKFNRMWLYLLQCLTTF
jgi:hypothetical protein